MVIRLQERKKESPWVRLQEISLHFSLSYKNSASNGIKTKVVVVVVAAAAGAAAAVDIF